jgi:hypothetical protein
MDYFKCGWLIFPSPNNFRSEIWGHAVTETHADTISGLAAVTVWMGCLMFGNGQFSFLGKTISAQLGPVHTGGGHSRNQRR